MQYLNKATLKAIIYMLHNDNKAELSFFNNLRNKNIIIDIHSYGLQDIFSFKINKEYVDSNIDKIKKIYNDISPEDKNAPAISLRKITKILIENSTDIDLKDLINISGSTHYSFINEALILNLKETQKDKLNAFLDEYILNFEKDSLTAEKHNYYHFGINISESVKMFTTYYNSYGKRFVIRFPLNENIGYDLNDDKLRLVEILFYLSFENFLNINSIKLSKIKNLKILNINITLNKTPAEIYDIEKYWISYGDIRVNINDGIAYYKNNRYPFKSTKTKAFKLLCYLVENHGNKVPINEAYDAIGPHIEKIRIDPTSGVKPRKRSKKDKIKDFIKEIKENLNITHDSKPSISIMVSGEDILLISNPPKKNPNPSS